MSDSWYRDDRQAADANVRNIIRSMVTQIEVPQLFPPKSIPGRAVDFDAAIAGSIPTAALADSSVTTAKLADSAVTSAKIADLTIATGDLADSSVTPAKTGVIPGCSVYNTGDLSIGSGSDTVVTFGSETFDTDTMHSTSVNTGRITFTTAGIYTVIGHVVWDLSATGWRYLSVRVDGSQKIAQDNCPGSSSDYNMLQVAVTRPFTAGQYVELVAWQGSGGSLNILGTTSLGTTGTSPQFSAVWVGKAV